MGARGWGDTHDDFTQLSVFIYKQFGEKINKCDGSGTYNLEVLIVVKNMPIYFDEKPWSTCFFYKKPF